MTDCRISGFIDPVMVTIGETFNLRMLVTDLNDDTIDLTGFTLGPLLIYKGTRLAETLTNVTNSTTKLLFNDIIPLTLKEATKLASAYNCRCSLLPPGGTPVAIINFKMLAFFMYITPQTAYSPEVAVKINAIYNTTTQTFDFNPAEFSSTDFSTT